MPFFRLVDGQYIAQPLPRVVTAVSAGGLAHPRAVCAGPSPPHAVTPLGDKVPPRPAAISAGPPSAFAQLRELHERHKREGAVIRAVLRRVWQRRTAWRPPVRYACPASTPRPREGGARMVASRHGTGKDDGSGGDDDGGGGDGGGGGGCEPPPSRLGARVFERERGRAQP